LLKEELHDLCRSSSNAAIVKYVTLQWAGHKTK
jgi:hypothetical protein